jgi:hypothetical protein
MYEQRLAVLSVGLAGCHGDTVDGASISFYDRRLAPYLGELVEGAWVIDKSAVLESRPGLAVLAPLCRGDLPLGTRQPFAGAEGSLVAHAIASDPDNPAAPLAQLALLAPACGAFDDVSPDVYAAWWQGHGARVGQRRGDVIAWADGEQEPIPPFAQRWAEGPSPTSPALVSG